MKLHIAIALGLVSLLPSAAKAQNDLHSFSAPIPVEMKIPDYPPIEGNRGEEGWVLLNFMVDVNGLAFEPAVLSSSGSRNFISESIRALTRSKWEPASFTGRPVEASGFQMYRFSMPNSPRAVSRSFKRQYEQLTSLIDAGNKDAAENLMASMDQEGVHNNFEDAHFSLAKYSFSTAFGGTDEEKIAYLERALMYDSYPSEEIHTEIAFLDESLTTPARKNLFMHQINARRYAEALGTYYKMRSLGVDVALFTESVEKLLKVQSDETEFSINGRTNSDGLWNLQLLKSGIYVHSLGNRINELRLRCRSKYQLFAFEEGVEYQIPESWGSCTLEVLGAANVEFQVVQF